MRKKREIARICLIVENTGLDPLCSPSCVVSRAVRDVRTITNHSLVSAMARSPCRVVVNRSNGWLTFPETSF